MLRTSINATRLRAGYVVAMPEMPRRAGSYPATASPAHRATGVDLLRDLATGAAMVAPVAALLIGERPAQRWYASPRWLSSSGHQSISEVTWPRRRPATTPRGSRDFGAASIHAAHSLRAGQRRHSASACRASSASSPSCRGACPAQSAPLSFGLPSTIAAINATHGAAPLSRFGRVYVTVPGAGVVGSSGPRIGSISRLISRPVSPPKGGV